MGEVPVKHLRSRRLWVGLALVVGLVLLGRWLDRSQPIQSYRVIDDRTIAVEVDASSPQWTRVTGVTETSDRVILHVGSFIFPVPQAVAGVGRSEELLVTLNAPLGSRLVIDGYTGDTIDQVRCPWSLWSQGRCAGQSSPP